ncbi:MAG: CsgG/HfaB family protein [Spirochaetes bacterium]|nr:CsgG/HfaB family protein [Spirochaetota bacterium]
MELIKRSKIFIVINAFFFFFIFFHLLHAGNEYETLAEELSEAASSLPNKKVAIIPFSYIDKRASNDGMIISERITTYIVNLNKLEVIERSQLDKVLKELDLEFTGIIDPATTKQLGKVLGVDAIITGSLIRKKGDEIEVNARVINSETAKVIKAYTVDIEKDWEDEGEEEPVEYKPKTVSESRAPESFFVGFIDIFGGVGRAKMDLKFERFEPLLSKWEMGVQGTFADTFSSISWKQLKMDQEVPLGLRIGAFMGNLGFALEVNRGSYAIAKYVTTFYVNDFQQDDFDFRTKDPYFSVSVFSFIFELFLKLPIFSFLDLYAGGGFGFSSNQLESPYIKSYTKTTSYFTAPTEETAMGTTYGVPAGLRIHFTDSVSLMIEGRYFKNSFEFIRNIENEKDEASLTMMDLVAGLTFFFGK